MQPHRAPAALYAATLSAVQEPVAQSPGGPAVASDAVPPTDAAAVPPRHVRPPQTVRGGFVVLRRGDSRHRLTTMPGRRRLYEHPSLESALAEAERLAGLHGREFAVFREVAAALPSAAPRPAGDA